LDSYNNGEEFIAGGNPGLADNPLAMVVAKNGGEVEVSFNALAASGPGYYGLTRVYDLEYCTQLPPIQWLGVPGYTNVVGNDQTVVAAQSPASGPRFYRLKVSLE